MPKIKFLKKTQVQINDEWKTHEIGQEAEFDEDVIKTIPTECYEESNNEKNTTSKTTSTPQATATKEEITPKNGLK